MLSKLRRVIRITRYRLSYLLRHGHWPHNVARPPEVIVVDATLREQLRKAAAEWRRAHGEYEQPKIKAFNPEVSDD